MRRARRRARESKSYEFLDHPADVGFVARGRTLRELFVHAARAMLDYGWDLTTVRARRRLRVRIAGSDRESLLYNWLAEILSRADAEGWAFKTVGVSKLLTRGTQYAVHGTVAGEAFRRGRHRARTYIKAVTYHQLAVKRTPTGWQATVYLDV